MTVRLLDPGRLPPNYCPNRLCPDTKEGGRVNEAPPPMFYELRWTNRRRARSSISARLASFASQGSGIASMP